MTELHGLVPVLSTPFTQTLEVDETGLRKLVAYQLASGADGVATLGFASEAAALTRAERTTVLELVVAEVHGAVPVIAGLGATGSAQAVEDARTLKDAGADVLMVLPPFLVKPDTQRLIEFYAAVAEAVDIPLMVQDAPEVGVPISVETLRRLADIPGVNYAKLEVPPTAPLISDARSLLGDELTILGGRNSQSCLEEFAAGAVGTMPASFMTTQLRSVVDRWFAGDRAGAQTAFNRILPLINLCANGRHGYAIGKEILRRQGVIATREVRNPMRPVDEAALAALDLVLTDLPELTDAK